MAVLEPSSHTLKDFIPSALPMHPAVRRHLEMSFAYIDASLALGKGGKVECSGLDSWSVSELKEFAKAEGQHSESAKLAMHVHELNNGRLDDALDVMCMSHYSCAPQRSMTQFRLPRATRLFLSSGTRPLQVLLDYGTGLDGIVSWSVWQREEQSTVAFGGIDGKNGELYFNMYSLMEKVTELVPETSIHLFFTETVPLSTIAAHFDIPNDTSKHVHVSVFVGFFAATIFKLVQHHLTPKLLVCGTSLGGSVATVFSMLAESAMRLQGSVPCVLCSTTNGVQCCRGKSPFVQEPCESAIRHFDEEKCGLFCAQFVNCVMISKNSKQAQFTIDPISVLNCERSGTLNFFQHLTAIGGGQTAHLNKRVVRKLYKAFYTDTDSNGQSSIILCLITTKTLAKRLRSLFKLPSKTSMKTLEDGARYVHAFNEAMFQVVPNVLTRFRTLSHVRDIELSGKVGPVPEHALSLYLLD